MDWADHVPHLAARPNDLNKVRAGKVLVVGGSAGMAGAPALAGLGALRAGAGLVYVAVPQPIQATVAGCRPELMTAALPVTREGQLRQQAVEVLMGIAPSWHAAVVGPGAGRHPGVGAHLRALTEGLPLPLVIDADGLGAWNACLEGLRERTHPTVLTPHAGEAARLLGGTAGADDDRTQTATAIAQATAAIVVLKGPGTLVTDGTRGWRCPSGGPLLATGGTGDVLSGVIAALLASLAAEASPLTDESAFDAVCAAVYVHGRAADRLAETLDRGVLASEIADQVPHALREIVT